MSDLRVWRLGGVLVAAFVARGVRGADLHDRRDRLERFAIVDASG